MGNVSYKRENYIHFIFFFFLTTTFLIIFIINKHLIHTHIHKKKGGWDVINSSYHGNHSRYDSQGKKKKKRYLLICGGICEIAV